MDKTYTRINWQNEPSVATPINDVNLNKMDYSLNEVDNRIISLDTSKADQSDLLQTVKAVTYNTTTGVFTFTFWNGTVVTADLNIEKIPVSFSMSPEGVITMTTADGTQYTADVSELIKTYSFVDSSEIDFTVTTDSSGNKSVTASIIAGSITGEKLQPNYLADCVSAKQNAELAAGSASGSATSSELSSEDSEAWAVGTRDGVPVPSTDPAYENNSKYWAEHGQSNSFAGLTDTSFTNLQNGQIAKYNSTTQKWENTEDEGGLLPHFKITSEAGSTVTVVLPDGVTTITPTQTSSGIWQCDVPAYGVYTVHAVINGDDAVRTVTVDTVKEYVIHDEHYSYTLNVYAPTGSSIIVTDNGSETYTGTGAGSTAVIFALHQASTTYTIEVTYDGLERGTTITSSATTGGSGSKTIEFGTINLTVDEDLIGETIVMAKGADTVSKVASSTSMVFYPNATGNWTISCEYEGETYYSEPNPVVVSSLSTAVSAEISLVHIPEGATVTPTDDIQTWLACANITDKSYTTLAEVLADRETFETLIADSNACDYMARSTTWAVNEGAVPLMTSNTTPSGVASCSSYITADGVDAYKAFDKNNPSGNSMDLWATATLPAWIAYKFASAKCIKKVYFENRNYSSDGNRRIKTYKVQASNDDFVSDIHDLTDSITRDNSKNVAKGADTVYLTDNDDSYTSYRLYITERFAEAGNQVGCAILQFYEDADITTDQDAMSLIGKYDYCSNALLSNATWASAIANSDYISEVLPISVPAMTSATTPSGVVSASAYWDDRYLPYKAFDGTWNTNGWLPPQAATLNNTWIQYQFTSPVVLNAFKIQGMDYSSADRVTTFKIMGSNDGTIWSDVASDLDIYNYNTIINYLGFYNSTSYLYYRLLITDDTNNSPTNYSGYNIQLYGRASSSSVSNTNGIIHTAMGNESVYCVETGDTFTATDGIATVDFSQFDEGVYTFGSTTAKNPNDLTEDFKKRFRITKSPYGGTTERYLLPDTIDTLYWYGYENDKIEDATSANGWSGAQSATYVAPTHNTLDIYCNSSGNYNFQAITTKQTIASASKIHSVMLPTTGAIGDASQKGYLRNVSSKSYDNVIHYYNFSTTSLEHGQVDTSNDSNFYIFNGEAWGAKGYIKALWYDRISSDIPTFISAANDMLYIMDGSNKIYIANTNGEGKSYEPLLEAGTYTIYSSVAKDPNNLSNPYSKTVTITEATQTVAIMPDNAGYWYGYIDNNLVEELSTANEWSFYAIGFTAPIYNTNNLTLNNGHGQTSSGLAYKTKKNNITAKSIYQSTTISSGNGGAITLHSSKSMADEATLAVISAQNTNLQTLSLSITSEGYITADATYLREGTLYAFWYE